MPTDTRIPGNMHTNVRTQMTALTSAQTLYFATDPRRPAVVAVKKNGEDIKVSLTSDARKADNAKLTDLEDSGVIWNEVSASGSTDYFAGDNQLITGVKVEGAPASSAPQISITQVDS